MDLSINITKLTPKNGGSEVGVEIILSHPEDLSKREVVKITVFAKMLFTIGNIGMGSLPYALTREQYDELTCDGEIYAAAKKGMDILAYGDNTERGLVSKLRQRGFDKYISEDAALYLAENGYIDEKSYLSRTVQRLADVKLYGKSRIKAELVKKGFSRDVISENLPELFAWIDFEENLYKLVSKKCDIESLSDPKYRESFYGAMYRYGYSPGETKEAINRLRQEQN